jgi:hypothetical protein
MRRADPLERLVRYTPLKSQKLFHDSPAKFKGFSGPIGSGKSAALCHEAIRMTYVNPGRTGLIGAPTYPMLRDATLAALLETLYANELPFDYFKAENTITMLDTGSRILLRAVDEFERLRGTNLAWFGLDELTYTKEGAWLRLEGRLRDPKAALHCGFGVWTPKGFDWVYERFIGNKAPGCEVIVANPFENRHVLGIQPDFYERLRGSYDERFYQQEVLGDYVNAKGGLVYYSFDRERNVAPQQKAPYEPVHWALDFNVDPMSSVVAQQGASGEIRVLDEIVLRQATTEEACAEFVKRFGIPAGGLVIYGDASGEARQTSGYSDYDVVRRFFKQRGIAATYRVPKGNPPVKHRVMVVNGKLRNAAGGASLVVDPKCRELIADFEQVAYLEDKLDIDKNRDRKRTHTSDALGYMLCMETSGGPTIGERGQRLF